MGDAFKKPLKMLPLGILGAGLFDKPKKPPPVATMPDPANQLAARKKAAATVSARSGRESTILSDTLGP